MEINITQTTVTSVGIRYALLLAVSGVLIDFIVRIAGLSFMSYGVVAGLSWLVAAVVFIVLAHSAFKKGNENRMSFGQGLAITMIMLLISTLVLSLFNYTYLHYIDTDFVEHMKVGMTEFMERHNVPDEQIAESTAKFDEMNAGLGKSIINGLKNGVIGGLILGAIISAFTKRNAPEFE